MHELISPKKLQEKLATGRCRLIPITEIFSQANNLDQKKIQKIMRHLEEGGVCRPIVVSRISDGYRIVGDGRHRLAAHRQMGAHSIACKEV